jgi:hypothetical protein
MTYLFGLVIGTIDGSSCALANMDTDNNDGHWVMRWQEVFCEAVAFCLSTTADGNN